MQAVAAASVVSRKRLWTGRVLSGFVVLFLLMDGVMKLFKPAPVLKAQAELGWPDNITVATGIVLLICTILYAVPWTAILGAILLTGYLGGAVAVQWRVGNPLFAETLFPVYMGILLWAGVYLRDTRLCEVIPLRR
ncbi:DoxX family protein [Alloacidobacterium sp.]|uniref:DoxX family protein n=1 Tax=Alloacidobacterium sp. TaxID=2951999 RepID=UPI002D4074B0|nr:DoxX family protein [Alloacidobacterium sp.]HYK38070.1 DoxX family protein [Alloacidobacterium sp.]